MKSGTHALRTLAVAAGCVAVALALDAAGRSARAPPARARASAEVLVVETDAEIPRAWRARGLEGRTVVHAGRFLHFVEDEVRRLTAATLTGPGTGAALDDLLLARAGPRDYLAVAASTGLTRRIFYVSPRGPLEERLAALDRPRDALPVRIDADATPRVIDAAAPALGERVVLDVNASWFDGGTAADLLAALGRAGLEVELATLSLARDAGDVSPAAREALRRFEPELAAALRRSPR